MPSAPVSPSLPHHHYHTLHLEMGSWKFFLPGLASTAVLLLSAFQLVSIISINHWCPADFLGGEGGGTWSCCADQAGFNLLILLPQSPECWDYRRMPQHLAKKSPLSVHILWFYALIPINIDIKKKTNPLK
jgi:hypothetical protein